MDKKSKFLLATFFSLIVVSVIITYYRYMILKDFSVYTDEKAFSEELLKQ